MPYADKDRDRRWHKAVMRKRRAILKLNGRFVTPYTLKGVTVWIDDIAEFVDSASEIDTDADGDIIYEE